MVVSRNLSCLSSRAPFFLYFATCFPLASLHSRLRSVRCMISEKRHSNGARKTLSRSRICVICGSVHGSKTPMDIFQEHREQMTGRGCLTQRLSGKGQKFFTALFPARGDE